MFHFDFSSPLMSHLSEYPVATLGVHVYTQFVTEKEVTRGESRKVPGRTAATKRFFFVCIPLRAVSYGRALVGVRLRTPVPLDAGLSTLPFARPPHLRVGTRVLKPVQGGRSVRQNTALPKQFAISVLHPNLLREVCDE